MTALAPRRNAEGSFAWITHIFRKGAPEAVHMTPIFNPIAWPTLHYGHNEPGPTGIIGEYRSRELSAPSVMRGAVPF